MKKLHLLLAVSSFSAAFSVLAALGDFNPGSGKVRMFGAKHCGNCENMESNIINAGKQGNVSFCFKKTPSGNPIGIPGHPSINTLDCGTGNGGQPPPFIAAMNSYTGTFVVGAADDTDTSLLEGDHDISNLLLADVVSDSPLESTTDRHILQNDGLLEGEDINLVIIDAYEAIKPAIESVDMGSENITNPHQLFNAVAYTEELLQITPGRIFMRLYTRDCTWFEYGGSEPECIADLGAEWTQNGNPFLVNEHSMKPDIIFTGNIKPKKVSE